MWRLVREDRSLRFWRVLILYPPTRRRRCNLSTFSVTPCTADYGTAVRAVAGRGLGTGYCDNSLTYTPPRNRTRCARRVLLRRPVVEPLQLCHKLLPASRSDTDLCSNCLVLWSARYVLHCEQEIHYHRLLSHLAVHSHYSPGGRADWSRRCSLATLSRCVRRRDFLALGYGNTPWRSAARGKRVWRVVALPLQLPLSQHTLSTAGAVARYRPLPKRRFVIPSPPRSTRTLRAYFAASLV